MSAKKLYERLVGHLLEHWMKLFPMVEWIGPEEATQRIVAELQLRREQVRQIREIAACELAKPGGVLPGTLVEIATIAERAQS